MIALFYFSSDVNRIEKWGRLVSHTIDKDLLLLITIDGKNGNPINTRMLSFLSDFKKSSVFSIHFTKTPNTKFYENPSFWNQVVPCGWTDRRADVTKLMVAFATIRKQLKRKCCDISFALRNV
jgi:hypothetical protein